MAIWQWALLALGLVWALQAFGVWLQMRHYADVFKGITNRYSDGFVGTGHARGRIGKGTIAIVVVAPDMTVCRVLVMSGRSVFTKFKRETEYEGRPLTALREGIAATAVEKGDTRGRAIVAAIEQIEKIRHNRDQEGEDLTEGQPAFA